MTVSELIQALQNLGPESQDREVQVFLTLPHEDPKTAVIDEVFMDGSTPMLDWDVSTVGGF